MWYKTIKKSSPLVETGESNSTPRPSYIQIGHDATDVILYFITKGLRLFKTYASELGEDDNFCGHNDWDLFTKTYRYGNLLCAGRYQEEKDICSCHFYFKNNNKLYGGPDEFIKKEVVKILYNNFNNPKVHFYGI